MNNLLFEDVKNYIDENILHSEPFDNAPEAKQRKAVNNAEKLLYSFYKRFNATKNPLPIEAIAHQTVYLLYKDDSALRAETGATSIAFNGVSLSYAQGYKNISPDVIQLLGRRTGSYGLSVSDTHRGMMYFYDSKD